MNTGNIIQNVVVEVENLLKTQIQENPNLSETSAVAFIETKVDMIMISASSHLPGWEAGFLVTLLTPIVNTLIGHIASSVYAKLHVQGS